jgi:hypothetical protein
MICLLPKLGRRRCTWKDNIRMDLRDIGWENVDWISPVTGSYEHGNEPTGSIKGREFLDC